MTLITINQKVFLPDFFNVHYFDTKHGAQPRLKHDIKTKHAQFIDIIPYIFHT